MSRSIKAFIIASVMLNLLLAGVVAGHFAKGFGGRVDGPRWQESVVARLPEDKQALYRETMKQARKEFEAAYADVRKARDAVRESLAAEPFDEAEYLRRVEVAQTLDAERKRRMAEAVANLAEQFTPEERAILAETLKRPGKKREPRPGKGEDRP